MSLCRAFFIQVYFSQRKAEAADRFLYFGYLILKGSMVKYYDIWEKIRRKE